MRFRLPVLALLLFGVIGCSSKPHDHGSVGEFKLKERGGSDVGSGDLRGKVYIAAFVFTRCSGPCPRVTQTMQRLQKEFADQKDVRLVTFTVDPEHDTAGVLQQYAKGWGADPERWLFLTGEEADVYRLLREGFKIGVQQNTGPDRKAGDEVTHSTKLVLVDKRGHIRGYFEGVALPMPGDDGEKRYEDNLARLKKAVAALVREEP